MPRSVITAEVSCVYDEPIVLVDPVVSLLQSEGGKIGEHFDEYFVGELKYCKAVVGSKVR